MAFGDHSQQAPTGNNGGYGEKNYDAAAAPTRNGGKRKLWPWLVAAVVLICVILAAVLGGVLGSRAADDNHNKNNSAVSGSNGSGASQVATRTKGSANNAVYPTATDQFGNPMYPTTTGSAKIASPTVIANSSLSCGSDPYTGASLTNIRNEHPLLIAPSYKWECLSKQIAGDSYMSYWNDTIFQNATIYYNDPPTNYSIDGCLSCSGVLDVARQVQLKIKHYAYAYKLSNDTKWVDRTWLELQTAAGNTSQYFGVSPDNWNSVHFLDLAEFTEAFALAYDWLYDAWTADQRTAIMWSIINLGLKYGHNAYYDASGAGADYSWWTAVDGNWNCVCNKGLTMGALAIANEDPTGIAAAILNQTVPNAQAHCSYFGTYSHVEMAASLLSATGSTQNMLDANPGMKLSAIYHMYVTGMQGLFNYGDCGPNKYTATANGLMFYGAQYSRSPFSPLPSKLELKSLTTLRTDIPMYTLFQRDRGDAPEPMAMLYYDPQVSGDWWDGLALDRHFSNTTDGWFSSRSSWTDSDGMYIAMKAGQLTGHQTHGDLDAGDFVLDAMGQRWAGELGSANYLANGYFTSEDQDAQRWTYYRKATPGQNTLTVILRRCYFWGPFSLTLSFTSTQVDGTNQLVSGVPQTTFDTTGESQDALAYTAPNTSTAYFVADLSEMFNSTTVSPAARRPEVERDLISPSLNAQSSNRAIRFLNGRRQVLLRDEITGSAPTNATVTLSNNNQTATLALGDQTLIAELRQPSTAAFATETPSERISTEPALLSGTVDQPNPGVTVLSIDIPAPTGGAVIEVLFNPQWPGWSSNSFVNPPDVAISSWSLTSHD
ncbi:SPOSA6832_02215, partial [Sporobolomyces salmonicolor]